MTMPFPGMDPYLENPILWTGVHTRLINSISGQIAPALRPRYVVSIEERVVIDLPQQQRVPDLRIQKTSNSVREEGESPPSEQWLTSQSGTPFGYARLAARSPL